VLLYVGIFDAAYIRCAAMEKLSTDSVQQAFSHLIRMSIPMSTLHRH